LRDAPQSGKDKCRIHFLEEYSASWFPVMGCFEKQRPRPMNWPGCDIKPQSINRTITSKLQTSSETPAFIDQVTRKVL